MTVRQQLMGFQVLKKLVFAALGVSSVTWVGVAVAAPPSPEAFGALPVIESVSISPSGKYFAIIQNLPEQTAVKTFDAESLKQIGGIAAGKQQTIDGAYWYSDDRLILTIAEVDKISAGSTVEEDIKGTTTCQMMSIPRDAKNPVKLRIAGMLSDVVRTCAPLSLKGPEPDTILVQGPVIGGSGLNSRSQIRADVKVQKINIVTGAAEVIDEVGSRSTVGWGADGKGNVRLRFDYVAGEIVTSARLEGSSGWNEMHRQTAFAFEAAKEGTQSTASVMFFGPFAADPNKVYVYYWPGDRLSVGLFDLGTRQITPVFTDPKYDVSGVFSLGKKVVGASIIRSQPEREYFSQELKQIQARIEPNYPGHRVVIVQSTEDLNKHVLFVQGPKWPGGAYALLDLKANEATLIGSLYPTIDHASTGDVKYITYTARDGLKIDAYLTVPRAGGKNLPAIVVPHGGPESRDFGGFDLFAQFFASRGYVVLQPQFRGSEGFGTQFSLAGKKQWGLKMQDDVSDGVKYLTSSGIADPSKVCIMGWSYGGYAAMAGATLTPELYRCVIAGAGVSDLDEMLRWSGRYAGSLRYWRQHIGDPTTDKAAVRAASPAKLADKVKAPMLLIHGELDSVVPIKQSEIMADALKAAGKPHEFVRLPDEGHSITFASTRTKTMKAMDEFLAKHNPAR